MSIHPQIIEQDGRKELVMLPYDEFLQMQAKIEEYEDLRTLREEKATAHGQANRSLYDILKKIGKWHALRHCALSRPYDRCLLITSPKAFLCTN